MINAVKKKTDMTEDEFNEERYLFLTELQKSEIEIINLEGDTFII